VWTWPVGIVGVALYVVVFYQTKLYGETGLQVVYIVLSIYGWHQWLHGGAQRAALPVSQVTTREGVVLGVVGVVGAWLLGELLYRNTDASIPYLDSALVSASLVAQWMMTRKQLECWLVWIAADLVYVGTFIYKALYLTAFLYAGFTVLAVMGYREWRASLRARVDSVQPAHGW
jgi:nicotinamide mononucleotide transporter